ncbi:DUF3011 domain-containing protein [Lysobacter enzymogenes]|uniref:DUF3011 domain-containing protein n=1 Tax=Lysobacter enzymogenes TaxID=69 RepID=UPI0037481FB1
MYVRIASGLALATGLALCASAEAAPQYNDYGGGNTIRCESDGGRQQYCDADTRGGVRLNRQLSKSSCIQGRSWGYDRRGVWVSQGCRADFEIGRGGHGGGAWGDRGRGGGGGGQVLTCDSNKDRQNRCNASVRRGARLIRQNSNSPCIEGQSWGWDRNGVWVSNGCRGQFQID